MTGFTCIWGDLGVPTPVENFVMHLVLIVTYWLPIRGVTERDFMVISIVLSEGSSLERQFRFEIWSEWMYDWNCMCCLVVTILF